MILGFKLRFVGKIMDRTKIHTIREDKTNRWKSGRSIQMATGVRTKKYLQFGSERCFSTQRISIKYNGTSVPVIKVAGRKMGLSQHHDIAVNDGFMNRQEFYAWFNKNYKGKIIHWTDFKY